MDKLEKEGRIRSKSYETGQILSLLEKIEENTKVTFAIPLTEKSADVVFTQMYELLRQLGDALWWLQGYEPQYHDISLEILKNEESLTPEQKVKLHSLSRFREIRHDSHYRGLKASYEQAQEIKEFLENVGSAILTKIKADVSKKKNGVEAGIDGVQDSEGD